MRAFLAIDLPATVKQSLSTVQQRLASSQADVKWVEPHQLHLTLKFLDEISTVQQTAAESLVRHLTSHQPVFSMSVGPVGAFPSAHAPRVLWVGVQEGQRPLTALAHAIEQASPAAGWPSDARPFSPHITLGRVRSARNRVALVRQMESLTWNPPPSWPATAVTLYESRLASTGPCYTALVVIPFSPRTTGSSV